MTTAMKKNDVSLFYFFQTTDHFIKANAMAVVVVVGIGFNFKARRYQQRHVVGPGWITYPNSGIWIGFLDELSRKAQAATATRRLYGYPTITQVFHQAGTKNELGYGFVVASSTSWAYITFRHLTLQN